MSEGARALRFGRTAWVRLSPIDRNRRSRNAIMQASELIQLVSPNVLHVLDTPVRLAPYSERALQYLTSAAVFQFPVMSRFRPLRRQQ